MSPIIGSFTSGRAFGKLNSGGGGIPAEYFSVNGYNLISGISGSVNAEWEKVYSTPGSYTYEHPPTATEAYVLIVGGGGGGGAYHAGGGGAGGVVYGKINLTAAGSTAVVVGNRGRVGIRDGNGG